MQLGFTEFPEWACAKSAKDNTTERSGILTGWPGIAGSCRAKSGTERLDARDRVPALRWVGTIDRRCRRDIAAAAQGASAGASELSFAGSLSSIKRGVSASTRQALAKLKLAGVG